MSEFPVCESHATGLSRVTCALRLPRALRLPSCLSAQRKKCNAFSAGYIPVHVQDDLLYTMIAFLVSFWFRTIMVSV